MDRGVLQNSLVQQMMGESLSWWSTNNLRPPNEQASPLLPSSSPSSSSTSSGLQLYTQPSNFLQMTSCHDNQDLPVSWSQLLLGGFTGEEERGSTVSSYQAKKMDNWRDELVCLSTSGHMLDVNQEISENIGHVYGQGSGENQLVRSVWSQILPTSSPSSCVTTSSNSSMLEFSNSKSETRQPQRDHSSECNSIESGSASKKARVQPSSSAQSPPFKVRKEKVGDRITALHQLVSPFGKTDTASVLQEAIGYIRFLHSQVEVLSSPYWGNGLGEMRQHAQGERNSTHPEDPVQVVGDEAKEDLRSRGLCLVRVSCTSNVCSINGADYWAPALGRI